MKNYVYILECNDGTFYTGWTVNLEKRIKSHNEGTGKNAAKYTRARRPVKLVYSEALESKSEALKREAQIKRLTRQQKEKLILKNAQQIST
ncbi:MAG: GIY-YIG nuclease family protein [Aminipila sp.]